MADNKVQISSSKRTTQIVNQIDGLKVSNKDQAINILSFVKSSEKTLKELKSKATKFLLNRCKDCANHFNTDQTVEASKVEKFEKVWNDSKLSDIESKIESLKQDLAAERLRVLADIQQGIKNEDGTEKMTEQLKTTFFLIK